MSLKIGFYGAGNMGKAIINGIIEAKISQPSDIYVNDVNQAALDQITSELNIVAKSQKEIAESVDILILAVKPAIIPLVLKTNKDALKKNTIIVSIAAGVTLAAVEKELGTEHKLVRVMPNTPALVGEGMSALCFNDNLNEADQTNVLNMFRSFGKAEVVGEYLIDAVVGVSGSAPAYVYMFIEALADGAVVCGMPRPLAYEFAAQTVLGSAKMVIETKQHPGVLKDNVCSPGGTTIAAVSSLENDGFRKAVINAVVTAAEKNKAMGGN